jgi:hypothetical protein
VRGLIHQWDSLISRLIRDLMKNNNLYQDRQYSIELRRTCSKNKSICTRICHQGKKPATTKLDLTRMVQTQSYYTSLTIKIFFPRSCHLQLKRYKVKMHQLRSTILILEYKSICSTISTFQLQTTLQ